MVIVKFLFKKMPRVPKCCVINCADKTSIRHRFPKNEKDVFAIWKQRAQNPRFNEITDEHIYKVYTMCGAHFKPEDQIPNSKKLKKRVLPTVNIPGLDDAVKMIENVSAESEATAHDSHHEMILKVDVNTKPVKRILEDDPINGKASKKPRTSSANDESVQIILTNNEPGNNRYIGRYAKYRQTYRI